MSVAVGRRTGGLWPLNAAPLNSGPQPPRQAAVLRHAGETEDPATEALTLAAITFSYRHDRERIISGDTSSYGGQVGEESRAVLALLTHPPTVPLAIRTSSEPVEVSEDRAADQGREVTTWWSRLARTRRPAPRGRHSPKC